MNEALTDFLVNLKNNPKVKNYDEAATKQAIILPLLQLLGWDTHNIEEVTPEFSVESRRVDYSLRSKNENEVFLEVKKAGEDLERYEEQLLDYSFRQGVELAVLTNGVTFWFYLPKQRGDWKARKFYTIDVIEQEIHDVTQKFGDLLSKVNILAGNALQAAENIYKGKLRKKVLEETLPAAWDRLISEPNTLLLDQLSETVEKLCGFKPEANEVTRFLRQHETEFLLLSEKSTFQRPMKIVTTRDTEPNKFSSKLFGETGDKKNTYSHVEVLDYVNYYGLIEAKQIMFCTRRSGQHRLVLWCKSTRSSKYELSEEGKRYEQSLPIFRNSSYIADVECISFNNNNLNMWKELFDESLFPFWNPKTGPFDFNSKKRKQIAICRVYKINYVINKRDIGSGQTSRKVINRQVINGIQKAIDSKIEILDAQTFSQIKTKIEEIVNRYS